MDQIEPPLGHFHRRRARLRPEYAALYPGVVAGLWLGARRVAGIVRRSDPTARERERAAERLLPEAHFEFRGGPRAPGPRLGQRDRATDRAPLNPGQSDDAAEGTRERSLRAEGTLAYPRAHQDGGGGPQATTVF
jgi:hypothetical protein